MAVRVNADDQKSASHKQSDNADISEDEFEEADADMDSTTVKQLVGIHSILNNFFL